MKTHPEAGVPDGSARKGTNGAAGSAIAGLMAEVYTDDASLSSRAVLARLKPRVIKTNTPRTD